VTGGDGRPWAATLPLAELVAVAALRLMPGVRACVVGDQLWVRGDEAGEEVERALDRVAPAARFSVLPDGALVPRGRLLPDAYLPTEMKWLPLSELLRPVPPPAALPGVLTSRAGLALVRSSEERAANVLVTTLQAFAAYADGAPAVRLERLRFAADGERALIWGDPLPPLPGDRYAECAGVAAPCGYTWRPALDAGSLARALGLTDGELALLATDGTWQRVPAASFVRARRSAVRFTSRGGAGVPR
jgi:hypothetical protein